MKYDIEVAIICGLSFVQCCMMRETRNKISLHAQDHLHMLLHVWHEGLRSLPSEVLDHVQIVLTFFVLGDSALR